MVDKTTKKLKGISDIRRLFHRNDTPIYFISATNFNLLGMDEWVKNFKFISYIDCYDGRHPNTFVPSEIPHDEFQSIEDINNYLLTHPEVLDLVGRRGGKPKAVFLMFDQTTEKLAKQAGMAVWFPKAKLRKKLDHKVETVRVGNAAGVASVPNVLAPLRDHADLKAKAKAAGLGDDLVVQTAYGDSGHTTYFIKDQTDWDRHAKDIVGQGDCKIMKRIACRQAAIEACTTKAGTIVGPLMTEIVGFKELTPYQGGWAGNEIFADSFTPKIRKKARDLTFKFGEQLRKEGYRGYFELDFLIDKETDQIWLGELNPRVTGCSSMTNHAAFAHADAPLFLFHLLEFSDIKFEFDIKALNDRWADPDNVDSWAQLVIKHTDDALDRITEAPQTGIWHLREDGRIEYGRFDYHRRAVENENEAFFLRIAGRDDYRYEGADLGILITRGRLMTKDFQLNERAKTWIKGIRDHYRARPLEPRRETGSGEIQPGAFKIL